MALVAWFHCFAGVAGDMTLASLIDAGADADEVIRLVRRLPVPEWELQVSSTQRTGLGGTYVHVATPDDSTVVRTYAHISGLIEEARLPPRVRQRAQTVFLALAEAEARAHNKPVSQVHFHEVGGVDAIVDIVGSCAALEVLGVDEIACSPIAQGIGMIRSAHGAIPNPPPAVMQLLAARQAPTYGRDVNMELTTPTGAALMCGLAAEFGPMPRLDVKSVGYGAGTRDIDGFPNMVQVVLGERAQVVRAAQPMVLLEANLDDVTGEVLAHAVAKLLDEGAADAWVTPIVMKKGRSAHLLSALSDPSIVEQLVGVIVRETGSLGVRTTAITRWAGTRSFDEVEVDGLPVRIKVGTGRAKAEFDDAAKVSQRTGEPLREVLLRAEAAWRRRQDEHAARGVHPTSM